MIETNTSRWGGWEPGTGKLAEVSGEDMLGKFARSHGVLGTLELDTLSWLTARWSERGAPADGVVCCTIYELGQDLYGRKPGGKEVRMIRAAIRNLLGAVITIGGYDVIRGEPNSLKVSQAHFVESAVWGENLDILTPTRADAAVVGALRESETYEVKLAPWLVTQLLGKNVTYLDWRIQRELAGLAKRLWIYLEAERYKPTRGGAVGVTYIVLAEKAYASLGVRSARDVDKRRQLKAAAARIMEVSPRYESITVEPHPINKGGWWLTAYRIKDDERVRARREIRLALVK